MTTEKKEKVLDVSSDSIMIERISAICHDLSLSKELGIPQDRLADVIRTKFSDFRLVAGRSNEPLAQSIADHLGIKLMNRTLKDFGNTELKCQLTENVRDKDIYILQSGGYDDEHSINDYVMELYLMACACRRSSAKSVTAITPFYPYARGDKKDDGRTPIGASEIADLLAIGGVSRITAVDLHAGQIQGMFRGPFDNIYAKKWIISHLLHTYLKGKSKEELMQYVWISPDFGGVKRVCAYAEKLGMRYAVIEKKRDYTQMSKVDKSVVHCDFDLKGNIGILIDDMIDTCGTMTSAVNELEKRGMSQVIIVATHGVLSGDGVKRINECKNIEAVFVTDTLDMTKKLAFCPKLRVIPLGEMFAEVLVCMRMGASVSKLLE